MEMIYHCIGATAFDSTHLGIFTELEYAKEQAIKRAKEVDVDYIYIDVMKIANKEFEKIGEWYYETDNDRHWEYSDER